MKILALMGKAVLSILMTTFILTESRGATPCHEYKVGTAIIYDDNVFEFSYFHQDSFVAGTGRFKDIDSIDDVIFKPSLAIYQGWQFSEGKEWGVGSSIKPKIHFENTERDYQTYEFYTRYHFSQRSKIKLEYTFIPNYFLRNLTDDDQPSGDRFENADFTYHAGSVGLWQEITERWSVSMKYTREDKNYNSFFNERDIDPNIFSASLSFLATKNLNLNVGYAFETADARASDEFPDVDPDISYDQHSVRVQGSLQLPKNFQVKLIYSYAFQDFTTDNSVADDPVHADREDQTHLGAIEISRQWSDSLTTFVRYEYETKGVDFAPGVSASAFFDEGLDFSANRVSGGIIYNF